MNSHRGTSASDNIRSFFNKEKRKHPSFLLFDRSSSNFLLPSEEYARELLGRWDSGLNILEIGCGDGTDSITLAGNSNRVWAIDIAETRIDQAKKKVDQHGLSDRISLDVMDAHNLDFPDEHFDLIIGNSVLLFLDRDTFSRQCYRVLKPGGRALFPNESMKNNPILAVRRALPAVRAREAVANRLTINELAMMGRNFDDMSHREFYLFSVLFEPFVSKYGHHRVMAKAANTAYLCDELMLRNLKALRRYCWISVIEFRKDGGETS